MIFFGGNFVDGYRLRDGAIHKLNFVRNAKLILCAHLPHLIRDFVDQSAQLSLSEHEAVAE